MRKRIYLFSLLGLFTSFVFGQDLAVTFVLSPLDNYCVAGSNITGQILVNNTGASAVAAGFTFGYTYRLNNGAPVTVTQSSAAGIPAFTTQQRNFATGINLSAIGTYEFKFFVDNSANGDGNQLNDTLFKTVLNSPATVAGSILKDDTVCTGTNLDTLVLTGNVGDVEDWIKSTDGGSNWSPVAGSPTIDTFFIYSGLTQTTLFSATVRSGGCNSIDAAPAEITVDVATVAGTISGAGSVCIGSGNTLTLSGNVGDVVDWESSQSPAGPWTGLSNTTTTQINTNFQTTSDTLFRARVKLGVCNEETTLVAEVTLDPPSVGGITSQSLGSNPVCSGPSNSGKIRVDGFVGTIQNWETSTGGAFTSIGQAGIQEITFNGLTQTTTFRAVIKSGNCPAIVSTSKTITVNAQSVGGTVNPPITTVCSGGGGTLNLVGKVGTVQGWEFSINGGGTWNPVVPANISTSLTYSNLLVTTLFRAQVKNGVCLQVPSASATITVNPPTVGGNVTSLDPTTVCAPTNTGDLDYAGGSGTIVDWEQSTDGVTFTSVPGALFNSTPYTFNNLTTTTHYRVIVQNAGCAIAYSDTITITVLPASVAGSISGTSPICLGSTANLSLSGQSGLVQKWRVSTDGGTIFNDVASSALQTSITPTVSANSLFQAIIQNGLCPAETTANFAVNVDPVSVGGTIAGSAGPVCGGVNSTLLTLSGQIGNIIDWELSINGGTTWVSVPGALVTVDNFTATNLTQTTMYRVRVKSGTCTEVQSATHTINVTPAAVGGTASMISTDTLCASNVTVTVQLTGHTGTVIGWEASENGGASYTTIAGASGTPESFSYNYTVNTLFRAQVQNGGTCPIVKSTPTLVVVGTGSDGGTTAGTATVCGGSNNGFVTVSGNVGGIIRWESSTNNGVTWNVLPSSASTSFNYVGLNFTTWFRAVAQDATCPIAISDTAIITIIPAAIGGTMSYVGPNVCAGNSNYTLNLSGSSGTIQKWQKSINGTVWTDIVNTTTSFDDSDIVANTYYRAVLQTGACPAVNSSPDTVFVDQISDAGVISGTVTHCDTGNVGEVLITSYTGNILSWYKQLNGGGFAAVSGSAAEDTISYLNLAAGNHEYKVVVDNGVCPNDTSNVVIVSVDTNVNPGTLTGSASYCSFVNSTLMQLNGYTSSVVKWQQSINGGTTFTDIAGTVARDTVTFVNVSTPTIYRVLVSSGFCGNDTSNTQTIGVGQSIGGILSKDDSVCISGHTGLLQLNGSNGSIVTWQDSVSGGSWVNHVPSNAGIDTLRYTNLLQTTSYRVEVQSGSCLSEFSTVAVIKVYDTVFAGTLGSNMFLCDTTNSDTLLLANYFGPIKNWQFAIDGGLFTNFSPAKTDSAYIFNNLKDSITEFKVVMDGGVCGIDISNIVSVKVGASLGGVLVKGDTVCSGNNKGVIKLTNYKGNIIGWDSSTVSGIFAPISHSLDSLVYIDIDDTTTFRVRVQNPGCPADTSSEVTIVTVPGTSSGILTGSRSICSLTNTDSVILVGRSGNILQWEVSTNLGASWSTIVGQVTDTFIYNNLATTTLYRVIIQAAGICPNDTSNIVTIQVGPSNGGSITGPSPVCAGTNVTMNLNGYLGDVLVWENSTDGLIWNAIPSSDTNKINIPVFDSTYFRAVVQSDTCTTDTSIIFLVAVDQPFTGTLITPTTQLCYGIGSDTIKISDPVGMIFDWEFRDDTASSYTSLANTLNFQTYSNLIITTHYRTFVQNGVCPIDTAEITLVVDTFTVAGTISAPDTICAGKNTGTLIVQGHIANTFTWQSSTNGGASWANAPGTTNDTFYVYNNLTDTTLFRLVLASGGCPSKITDSIEISVKPAAIGGIVAMDTSYCKVPNQGVLKLSGYAGNIVGWQQSINGGGFANLIPPVVADSLTYSNIDTTTSYRVILSLGDCPNDTSSTATITILKTPITSISVDGPTEFCEGDQVTLTATGGPDYNWSSGDTIGVVVANVTGNYVVIVSDPVTGCTDTDSQLVTVNPIPLVNAGNDVAVLKGQSIILNASGAKTYEWTPKSSLSDGFIGNPTASPTDSTIYLVIGVDSNGCENRDSVLVAVLPGEPEGPPTFTNLFTPNGDGHNDYWNITGIADCKTCKVAVYNRYGQPILEDNNYQNDWEGTFNGSKLPDGTYYYLIETEKGKIYKGAISIVRGE